MIPGRDVKIIIVNLFAARSTSIRDIPASADLLLEHGFEAEVFMQQGPIILSSKPARTPRSG